MVHRGLSFCKCLFGPPTYHHVLPSGSNHKEAASPTQERLESAEEEEDEEEDEEGEQRPLCSAVPGYPLVRDHALSSASNGSAQTGQQEQAYKGEQSSTTSSPAAAHPSATFQSHTRGDLKVLRLHLHDIFPKNKRHFCLVWTKYKRKLQDVQSCQVSTRLEEDGGTKHS